MGFLSTSGLIVLVCVLAGFYLAIRRTRGSEPTSIEAEKLAADVLEDPALSSPSKSAAGLDPAQGLAQPSGQQLPDQQGLGPSRPLRLALFYLGMASGLGGLILLGLGLAQRLPLSWALLALLLSFASLASLRWWALKDRDRRRALAAARWQQQKQAQAPRAKPGQPLRIKPPLEQDQPSPLAGRTKAASAPDRQQVREQEEANNLAQLPVPDHTQGTEGAKAPEPLDLDQVLRRRRS